MSEFVFAKPKVEFDYTNGTMVLLEDYVTPECTVPKGFRSNGASTGRALQSFYPSFHTYLPAALVHDYMYATGMWSREEADKLFKYNMEVRLKLSWRYYQLMYVAVRVGGESHYKGKK
ncbi:tail assembly chaperone [Aeromonas phage D3]|uniref:DUF1353 domain-containing protein n=2 Tax=Ludhianavirus TaxID=3044751 RepID=A0A514TVX7_9CAUD|nr:tail assembly chaperone [Aeromonas phage D3]YP_010668904.1 tail assembly chaperone [Aeromonas phage D6]QDJ97153.1 hypothetical protein D3_0155 [Aeromonas phage D3]QDJ97316.1 hypothetical protein D6_0156 [Aeromonas phage D6]QEP52461.1 hypothetical protein D9_0254 [Aeromonas phage D9]